MLVDTILAAAAAAFKMGWPDAYREGGRSAVATEALQRIAQIYRAERELAALPVQARLDSRQAITKPMWEQLHAWLQMERTRVPDGSATAKALNYSLNAWAALMYHLVNGEVPVDDNHCENLIRPWAMGRKAWLFCGSELAGQRAAVVMILVQSAKLGGHDPWAYLKDILTLLPTQLNSRIDELLPHNWLPASRPHRAGRQGGQTSRLPSKKCTQARSAARHLEITSVLTSFDHRAVSARTNASYSAGVPVWDTIPS